MRNLYLLILFIFLLSCTNSKTYESISLKIDLLKEDGDLSSQKCFKMHSASIWLHSGGRLLANQLKYAQSQILGIYSPIRKVAIAKAAKSSA